jgi:hypothetical protein
VTLTDALYQPVEHVVLLQAMVVAGATVSIWMIWLLAASALPALSTEKNLTVLVLETVNDPVYTVLDVVGGEPLVV